MIAVNPNRHHLRHLLPTLLCRTMRKAFYFQPREFFINSRFGSNAWLLQKDERLLVQHPRHESPCLSERFAVVIVGNHQQIGVGKHVRRAGERLTRIAGDELHLHVRRFQVMKRFLQRKSGGSLRSPFKQVDAGVFQRFLGRPAQDFQQPLGAGAGANADFHNGFDRPLVNRFEQGALRDGFGEVEQIRRAEKI